MNLKHEIRFVNEALQVDKQPVAKRLSACPWAHELRARFGPPVCKSASSKCLKHASMVGERADSESFI